MEPVSQSEDMASARVLTPLALPEGTRVGRWRVEAPLGRGGYGAVYRVREAASPLGPVYALKLAQAPEDTGFGREAEALRRVKHPGVVGLEEEGRWQAGEAGYPYLVLEYAPGEGLYRWARVRNPCARQVAGLLVQVAEALEAAHRVGVLHRDFKGGNVVVRPGGRVLVLDWGAGVYPEAAVLTRTGHLPPGTPQYYSPQVARWRAQAARGGGSGRYPYTAADEQYAVGVTFFQVLADEYPRLRLPEEAEGLDLETLEAQPLGELSPRVPPALAALVMRLLASRPEARFASMAALAGAVREALAQADAAWEAPLFEWYAGPGTHSRTTAEEGGWGPVAPGQEAALVVDRQRRHEAREYLAAARWVRRRHPQALPPDAEAAAPAPAEAQGAPPPDAPVVASGPGKKARAPGPRTWRLLGGAGLLGAVALAGAGLTLLLAPAGSPSGHATPEAAGGKVAPASGPHHAAAPTGAPASPPPPTPQEESMPPVAPPARRGLGATLKRGAVAGCTALAACTGAQVRPTPNAPCPEGALDAMKTLGMRQGMQLVIHVDKDRPGYANEPLFLNDGPIVSRVFDSRTLPDGTLVKGRLWTRGKNVIGRYTELELPNGRRYPVCLVLCDADGCTKAPMSTPEQAAVAKALFFTVVDVFE